MRKRITFRQLNRDSDHRLAMLKNLATSLILHDRIMTTTARAKELRRVVEKLVTHAKKGAQAKLEDPNSPKYLHHLREAKTMIQYPPALVKLTHILGPRYLDRPGGYTRVMKLQQARRGDSSDMSYIEFVDRVGEMRPARTPTIPPQDSVIPKDF